MNVLEKDPEEEKRKQEEQRNIEEGQSFIMLQPHQIKKEKIDEFDVSAQMKTSSNVTEIRTVQVLGEGQNQNVEGDRQRGTEDSWRDGDRRREEEDRRRRDEMKRRLSDAKVMADFETFKLCEYIRYITWYEVFISVLLTLNLIFISFFFNARKYFYEMRNLLNTCKWRSNCKTKKSLK